jgi:hypothetical protein
LTTCNRLDIIKQEQAMGTHPDFGLMIVSCVKSAADLLQLARFWLCTLEQTVRVYMFILLRNWSMETCGVGITE